MKSTVSTPSGDRWWYQHVPIGYDRTTPWPMVIDFHGYAEGATLHRQVSGWRRSASESTSSPCPRKVRAAPLHWDTRLDSIDLQFVGQVLDMVERTLCIDPHRVFVTGYSNGAFLSSTIACEYADRVAAIAPVAGLRDIPGCRAGPARSDHRLPRHATISSCSTRAAWGRWQRRCKLPTDQARPSASSPAANGAIAPGSMDQAVPDILNAWAGRNGCSTTPSDTTVSDDTTKIAFSCPPGADVQLYRTEGGGHAWPGSQQSVALSSITGKTTMTIDATQLIWAFFQKHPLP